jgi:hypothetical protein
VVGKDGWTHPVTNETLVSFDTKGGATITLSGITGTFLAAETVTGGTSSATGVVATYSASTKTLVLNAISGTFQVAETLTGGTSAARATSVTIVLGPGIVTTPTINNVKLYKGFVSASGETIVSTKTAYTTYDYLVFSVQFNTQVVVTGQPYLPLTINGVSRQALYLHKAGFDIGENTTATTGGTATLLFSYRIQPSDVATASEVSMSSPINLNSGTIKSYLNSTNATCTFTPPTLSAISITSGVAGSMLTIAFDNTVYKLGAVVTLTTTWDRPITISGSPEIELDINGVDAYATYASGSGTSTLTFTYTVTSSVSGTAGEVSVIPEIQLNSGSLEDANGVPVNLFFTGPAGASTVAIDGVVPHFTSVSGITNGTHLVTSNIVTLTAVFNKPVIVTGSPEITLAIHLTNREAVYATGSGTNTLTFTYTIVGGDSCTSGQFAVDSPALLNSGTLLDEVGNAVSPLTFTPPTTTTVYVN